MATIYSCTVLITQTHTSDDFGSQTSRSFQGQMTKITVLNIIEVPFSCILCTCSLVVYPPPHEINHD